MPKPGMSARIGTAILSVLLASLAGAAEVRVGETTTARAATTLLGPDEYGLEGYTVTTIPAASFNYRSNSGYSTGACSCTTYECACFDGPNPWSFYAGVDIPAGAIIDFVGLQSYSPAEFQVGVDIHVNQRPGASFVMASLSSSAHGWNTDYNVVPIGYQVPANSHSAMVVEVELGYVEDYAFFAWVEIWWRRAVSPAPASPTFADVPADHPFYQFIEAIAAAGITAGCGGGNFCPDQPLTRKQEAAFLAKALGLHWPY